MVITKIIGSGIAQLIVLFGVFYMIAKIMSFFSEIKSECRRNKQKAESVRKSSEEVEPNDLIKKNEFICPICEKKESIRNSHECFILLDNNMYYTVRYCNECGKAYHKYKDNYREWEKNKDTDLPESWLLKIAGIVACGIIGLVGYHIYIGSMKFFWARFFFLPIILWMALTLVCKAFIKLQWCFAPTKPFDTPSLTRIKKCNALVN